MSKLADLHSWWLKLRSAEEIQASGWIYSLRYLQSHLLLLNLDSKAEITVNGRSMRIHGGQGVIGLPGQLFSIVPEEEGTLFVVLFDAMEEINAEAGRNAHKSGNPFPLIGQFMLTDVRAAEEICRRICREWLGRDASGRLMAQAGFYELLNCLLKETDSAATVLASDEMLSRTLAYMEQNYERNLTIDELSNLAGLSRYHYMRSFKAAYGVSAMDYLAELRINKAKALMASSSKPCLREVAREVGYNEEYFSRKFKQQTGIPPATFIRNRQRRIAAYSFPNIGQLLALQIVPFAAPMDHSWTNLYDKYKADVVTVLSHNYEFNLAALKEARPDVIIGLEGFVPAEEQERLREIAPALFVSWGKEDWRGHLRQVAQFLDVSAAAEAWLSQYDRLAASLRERIQRLVRGDTVLVVHRSRDGYIVCGGKSVAGVLYEDFGLRPAECVSGIECGKIVTPEELALFNADRILLMLPGGGDIRCEWEDLKHSEEWKRISSSNRGTVTPIGVWPRYDYSAYSQKNFLQTLPALFKP
ncbi:AraC family transcriptional regulator [Cohnella cellulosilytica]|uniref:AraC family transcriptional regulator n=1 Tax=Cohnella cellulosilytica TaxID=986710 RepID=A0ABW2FIF2_9BACL